MDGGHNRAATTAFCVSEVTAFILVTRTCGGEGPTGAGGPKSRLWGLLRVQVNRYSGLSLERAL